MTPRGNFINNIKFLREQAGLTLQEVATNLGITWKRYQQWERGNGTPGYNLLVKVADFYETGIDNLLTVDLRSYGELSGIPASIKE